MNSIKDKVCNISELSTVQISKLRKALPSSSWFNFYPNEYYIGFNHSSISGTWKGTHRTVVVTYAAMMELLEGKPMNTKEQAQAQYLVVQAEMERLKAIIDTPEPVVPKVGRVLHPDDLSSDQRYYLCAASGVSVICSYSGSRIDNNRILAGLAFYDEATTAKYSEYLKLEHELRMAQALEDTSPHPDGKTYYLYLRRDDDLGTNSGCIYNKVHFNTQESLHQFKSKYTRQQLILLIRGV
jgi:hypothetical protein